MPNQIKSKRKKKIKDIKKEGIKNEGRGRE